MGIQERQNFSFGNFGTFETSTNEPLAVWLTNDVDRDRKIFYVVLKLLNVTRERYTSQIQKRMEAHRGLNHTS